MRTVLAVAALSLCLAFASHAAELRPAPGPPALGASCIRHNRVSISIDDRGGSPGCAQLLSTDRVVPPRRIQRT